MSDYDVIQCDSEQEWLEARRKFVTASEIACVLGVDPWKSPLRLYHEKRGEVEPEDLSGNAAVQAGKALEPTILRMYEQYTDRKVSPWSSSVLAVNSDFPDSAATPDSVTFMCDFDGPVDAKNIGLRMASHWETDAPEGYRLQLQQQMLVLNKSQGSLAALIGGQDFRYFDYEANDRLRELIVEAAAKFMRGVREGIAPDPDETDDCTKLLSEMFPKAEVIPVVFTADEAELLDEWKVFEAERDAADAKLNRIKNMVRRKMGSAHEAYDPAGTLLFTWKEVNKKEHKVKATTYRDLRRKA